MTRMNIKTFSSLALLTLTIFLCQLPAAFAQQASLPNPGAPRVKSNKVTVEEESGATHQSTAPQASTEMPTPVANGIAATTVATTDAADFRQPAYSSLAGESRKPQAGIEGKRDWKRDWKGGWNSYPTAPPQTGNAARTPLTPGEKMRSAAKSAFISPRAFIFPAFNAVITQWGEDSQPHKTTEDEVADGLSRFAINYGKRSSKVFLSNGVYASLFKQDPRYRPSDKQGFGARAAHAVARVFVTDSDDGKLQPNYSRFAGSLTSSALANLYERSTPGHDRIGTDATFKRFAKGFISDALTNLVFREFWPDISGLWKR